MDRMKHLLMNLLKRTTASLRYVLPSVVVLTILSLVTVLPACPLAHEDTAPEACREDGECFWREGEFCDIPAKASAGVCRPRLDGAPDSTVDTTHDTTWDTTKVWYMDVLPDSDAIFDGDATFDGDGASTDADGADINRQPDANP